MPASQAELSALLALQALVLSCDADFHSQLGCSSFSAGDSVPEGQTKIHLGFNQMFTKSLLAISLLLSITHHSKT
jgi:hypothetical protein